MRRGFFFVFVLIVGLWPAWRVMAQDAETGTLPAEPPVAEQPTPKADEPDPTATTQPVEEEPNPMRFPRSMVAEFLLAVHNSAEEPERLKDAVQCLDLSLIEAPDGQEPGAQGPQLARDLNQIIDALLNVYGKTRDEIPESPETDSVVFPAEGVVQLVVTKSEDGLWRFSAETVAAIPDLLKITKEKTEELEKEEPPAETKNEVPLEYQSARATMTTFVSAMKKGDEAAASECLDLSEKPEATRWEIGLKFSGDLAFIMERIKQVVPQDLPDQSDGEPFSWYISEHGRVELVRMDQGPRAGAWLFSRATVKSIPTLFKALENEPCKWPIAKSSFWANPRMWMLQHVPPSLKGETLKLQTWQWLGITLLILIGYALHRLMLVILCGFAALLGRSEYAAVLPSVITDKLRPLAAMAMLVAWWAGLRLLGIPIEITDYVWPALKFVMTVVGVWASYRIIDLGSSMFEARAMTTASRLDDVLVPLLRKLLKIVVVAFGCIFILQALGISDNSVNKLFAGLGLGGLAFALAAKDTLSNFFGSVTVVLDRPFQVGDWIKVGNVEGTVESVGLRSCRIRTFYNSQITVPNADLMTTTVDNLGRRQYRRISCKLGVTYSTSPEQLDAFCAGIRELIRRHPYTRKDYYNVWVNEFGASSINILLYCFHETPEWTTELRERHRLFLDIMRLARKLKVEFAFPTQTIHIARGDAEAATAAVQETGKTRVPPPSPDEVDGEAWGRRTAEELAKATVGEPGEEPPPPYRFPAPPKA